MNQSYPSRTFYRERLSAKIDLANSLCKKKIAPHFSFYISYQTNTIIFSSIELGLHESYSLIYGPRAPRIAFENLLKTTKEDLEEFILRESLLLLFSN